jgi:2-(3-amino-3-carboxypropyl)histidine synthase
MEFAGYKLDLAPISKELTNRGYSLIGLHLPEGLQRYAKAIANYLEAKTQAKVVIASDPCYGACDLADESFLSFGIEASIEVGHAPLPSLIPKIPTFFLNVIPTQGVERVIKEAIPYLEGKRIGLLTTCQWIEELDPIKGLLRKEGFLPLTSKGDRRIARAGLMVGCNVSGARRLASKVTSFLFIGEGNFHPLTLLLSVNKPLIQANPFTNQVRKKELAELRGRVLRQRYQAIERAKEAKTYGILISTKKGQLRFKLARKIKEKLKAYEKEAYLFAGNEIKPGQFNYLKGVDCLISTACPRIAIDDFLSYKLPIITPIELEIALGERRLANYQLDEIS